ncbi:MULTISPECIES: hypothetical protein [Thiorhodovibrio]|uniref:hypothetical protein n=1 Tax=Thiorhodovibrio TaxID=61593 RepID=UPI00191422C8|nr:MULTISPECIES: hypothetical protein [Thiorhodovibrio]MBK5967583.1 hypothetical protein [Thiorhodovibrio winogradskyi]
MSIRTLLTTTALSAVIGLTSGLALAESKTAMEDAAIKADEAAEADALAAEIVDEEAVIVDEVENAVEHEQAKEAAKQGARDLMDTKH